MPVKSAHKIPDPTNMMGCFAGFMSRLFAEFIDALIISVSFVSLTWFVSVTTTMLQLRPFLGYSINSIPGSKQFIDALFGPVVAGAFTLLYVAGYHILFWALTGQTPGKALMGIRVIALDGGRLSPWRAALRIVAYVVSALPLYFGFLWILIDERRQAFHDKIAGTYVIYTWAARPDEHFLKDLMEALESGSHAPAGRLPPVRRGRNRLG